MFLPALNVSCHVVIHRTWQCLLSRRHTSNVTMSLVTSSYIERDNLSVTSSYIEHMIWLSCLQTSIPSSKYCPSAQIESNWQKKNFSFLAGFTTMRLSSLATYACAHCMVGWRAWSHSIRSTNLMPLAYDTCAFESILLESWKFDRIQRRINRDTKESIGTQCALMSVHESRIKHAISYALWSSNAIHPG